MRQKEVRKPVGRIRRLRRHPAIKPRAVRHRRTLHTAGYA
jgi:hypothetical protein